MNLAQSQRKYAKGKQQNDTSVCNELIIYPSLLIINFIRKILKSFRIVFQMPASRSMFVKK